MIIGEKPDFVIHCGDFFHQFKPSPGSIRFAIKILDKFKQENIPFYVIRGNHDASKAQAQRFGGTILKFLEELGYLIYVQDETIKINDNITFTGIGEYGKSTGDIIEEVLRNNPLDQKRFNILALHGYLQGQVSDAIYDISGYQLASLGFNYIALGHYHKQWEEQENKIYCPGSTEQTSLNDWGKPDKDGYFRKSGFYSIKSTLNKDEYSWEMEVERKEFNIRPKGRFTFEIKTIDSIESIIERANDFVKKHDLEGAIIRYDFIGELPIGKQSLINFSNLPAIKESKALHVMVNQQLSNITLTKASAGLSPDKALLEILEKSYKFRQNESAKWLDLVNETIKILGHKTINSEEAEEIKMIYDLVTDASIKMADIELKATETKKTDTKKIPIKSTADIKQIIEEPKNAKQADLAQFFKEGE